MYRQLFGVSGVAKSAVKTTKQPRKHSPVALGGSCLVLPKVKRRSFHKRTVVCMAKLKDDCLTLAGFPIEGISIGGQETCIILPSLKVAFDIGRCPQRAVFQETVLFSHCHMDHIAGVAAFAATRTMQSLKPPNLLLPSVNVPAVEKVLDGFRELDGSEMTVNLVPMEVGQEFALPNKAYRAQSFFTHHVVPSMGYLIYSTKRKLKEEYLALPGPDIKKLRDQGIDINYEVAHPEVAYTGDTTIEVLTHPDNADVLRAKLLIMEMTFVDDTVTPEHAHSWGHTHINDIVEHAHLFKNEAILFIHFSARYKQQDILEALDSKLPEDLRKRVTPLLVGFSERSSK